MLQNIQILVSQIIVMFLLIGVGAFCYRKKYINDDGAGGICGDVDPEAASAAAAVTPVPGGVGSVTTAILMDHVVTAAARSALQKK